MKVRVKFAKEGAMKFIGHLDIMRYFQKAIKRAGIDVAYSEGFSPHMIMSFAAPLGVGVTSTAEYFDMEINTPISGKEAVKRLNEVMVEGMEIVNMIEISDDKKKTGMAIVAAADYLSEFVMEHPVENLADKIDAFRSQPEIIVWKKTKKSEKDVNIKPMIYDMREQDGKVYMLVATGSVENLKPELVMQAFGKFLGIDLEETAMRHHRLEVYADVGSEGQRHLVPLDQLGI